MKSLLIVSLALAGAAHPACAQRGGSHGVSAGHSGGGFTSHGGGFQSHAPAPSSFASHAAPPSRGFSTAGRAPSMALPQLRYGSAREGREPVRRPIDNDSYRRFGHPAVDRVLRSYRGLYGGSVLVYSPYIDPGYYGYNYADTPAYDSTYPAAPQQADYPTDQGPVPPTEEAQLESPAYRPPYVHPLPEPDLGVEAAVTLIYKDGRPSEQIQNYMLTRTTLYVQEQRLREIPVADLDLPATEKINKAAGVDFRLPNNAR